MPHHMIRASNLSVAYNGGAVLAVNQLTLDVPSGQVLGLLGGNGAGKTSTMKTFGGVFPPSSGSLSIAGHDMTTRNGAENARRLTGYCPDTGGLIRGATVREHIAVALQLRNATGHWERALELVEAFDLTHVLDREAGGFSHGMSRRLSVLLAAIAASKALILDEPFDGVDPRGVEATEHVIRAAADAGLSVIVSTHLLSLLVQVSDRICVMNYGQLAADENADAFLGDSGAQRYADILRATS